ncbi:cysteine peptidase family C39 domain-containing protein, partial [Streptococcus suis]
MKDKTIKLRLTMKISNTECGLCCVRTILEECGYNTSLIELIHFNEPLLYCLSLTQLTSILTNFGIDYKFFNIHDIKALESLS